MGGHFILQRKFFKQNITINKKGGVYFIKIYSNPRKGENISKKYQKDEKPWLFISNFSFCPQLIENHVILKFIRALATWSVHLRNFSPVKRRSSRPISLVVAMEPDLLAAILLATGEENRF